MLSIGWLDQMTVANYGQGAVSGKVTGPLHLSLILDNLGFIRKFK